MQLPFAWQVWHFVARGPVTGACWWWQKVAVPIGKVAQDVIFCCVFCTNRIGTAARSGDQVQISWQAWHFVTRVKIDGSLARNARFGAVTCVIACLWLRSIYGGSCKTLRLRRCQGVKIGGSLARNARFEACTCVVLSSWLCSAQREVATKCKFRGRRGIL